MTHEWKDYERLAMKVARKHYARLSAQGAGVEFDDLMGEAMMTFVRASRLFDADKGVKFSTYLWRAIDLNLQRWAGQRRQELMRERSMDASLGEEGNATLHDVLPADDLTPDEVVERRRLRAVAIARLSPLARQVVLALEEPSAELVAELRRVTVFYALAGQGGYAARNVKLDLNLICTALEVMGHGIHVTGSS